jgi:hypothetical protein
VLAKQTLDTDIRNANKIESRRFIQLKTELNKKMQLELETSLMVWIYATLCYYYHFSNKNSTSWINYGILSTRQQLINCVIGTKQHLIHTRFKYSNYKLLRFHLFHSLFPYLNLKQIDDRVISLSLSATENTVIATFVYFYSISSYSQINKDIFKYINT